MRRLSELLKALPQAPALSASARETMIHSITADSRQVGPGTLFVALKGEKTNGADFIPQAIEKGAVAIITESPHRTLSQSERTLGLGDEKRMSAFSHWEKGGASRDEGCNRPSQHRNQPSPNPLPEGEGSSVSGGIITIPSENPRLALAKMAAAFYPRQPQTIVAVTGTDGKTSTADFTRQLWALMGYKAASIGTLGTIGEKGQELYPGTHTTPDPMSLHKMLQELHDAGYTHIAMEASSHGLDQYRLHGVRVSAAAFTNLTRDHLDYHKTEEAYFAAKAKLFSEFPLQAAVINVDDSRVENLDAILKKTSVYYIAYGQSPAAPDGRPMADQGLIIESLLPTNTGQNIILSFLSQKSGKYLKFWRTHSVQQMKIFIPLVGTFQIYNMLAAAGLVLADKKHSVEEVLALLPKLKGVPGRLELVATLKNGAAVYIDYAHTPAALANILKTLRPHTQNQLHVVFGCGGDRDPGKRPEMGKAAAELADAVIVTDDNPRSEDPAAIRASVMNASPRAKEIGDRREAIRFALGQLHTGDIVVIAGKGHEKTQTIGKEVLPFDDAEVARSGALELGLA